MTWAGTEIKRSRGTDYVGPSMEFSYKEIGRSNVVTVVFSTSVISLSYRCDVIIVYLGFQSHRIVIYLNKEGVQCKVFSSVFEFTDVPGLSASFTNTEVTRTLVYEIRFNPSLQQWNILFLTDTCIKVENYPFFSTLKIYISQIKSIKPLYRLIFLFSYTYGLF